MVDREEMDCEMGELAELAFLVLGVAMSSVSAGAKAGSGRQLVGSCVQSHLERFNLNLVFRDKQYWQSADTYLGFFSSMFRVMTGWS